MKPTSNRIRQNDPEGLRTRVLNAAADLFQVRGYHATSMKDLMQVTGVSGGALHHHFPSKKSLALAVIADRVAPDVRRTWIDPIRTAPSLAKGIAGVFAAIISGVDARGRVAGCPLNNLAVELALSDADFRSAIDAVFVEWQSALVERIAETRGGARLDRAKRTDAAAFIVSVYSGAMTLAKSKQNTLSLRSAASVLLHWLREREFAAESAA
jgi:AcrR family transcriptional regulator